MFNITIDSSEILAMEEALSLFPEKIEGELVAAMKESEDVVFLEEVEYPAPPTDTVNWDTPKQRRAFHYYQGWGGGDPHQRAGAFAAAWEEPEPTVTPGSVKGGVYSLQEWVKHVVGDSQGKGQSRIHEGRWETIPETASRVRAQVVSIFNNYVAKAVSEFKIK